MSTTTRTSRSGRTFSSEPTDEQIILQTKQSMPPLTPEDLFNVFGKWSIFYLRVMFLNGLIYGLTEVHYRVFEMSKHVRKDYSFRDCNDIEYDRMNETCLFSDRQMDKKSRYSVEKKIPLTPIGELLGAACASAFTKHESSMVLIASIVYSTSCLVMNVRFLPILKISQLSMAAGAEICRIAVLMHCLETVPAPLRPMGLLIMTCCAVLGKELVTLVLTLLPDWWIIFSVCGIIHFLSAALYYWFIPPSLLSALSMGKSAVLTKEIQKRNTSEDDMLDVALLIGDVNSRGEFYVSKRESVYRLFRVTAFRCKLIILIVVLSLFPILEFYSGLIFRYKTPIGKMELGFLFSVIRLASAVLSFGIVHRFGRRLALMLPVLFAVAGQLLHLVVRLEKYNVCTRMEAPISLWAYLAVISGFLVYFGAKMGEYAGYLLLLEHIPTRNRRFVFPLAIAVCFLLELAYHQLDRNVFQYLIFYPGLTPLPCIIWSVVAGILCLFMDNSGFMCITTGDIVCYRRKPIPYPEDPVLDDEKRFF